MATKLGLINNALLELGHRTLADTGEKVAAGRNMTQVYDNVVNECLSSGSWNFAMETIKAEYDTGVAPNFGYAKVFAKPVDWVRTNGISEDEYLTRPLLEYYDDSNYWSSDISPIYVRYVSNDTGMGLELTRWTPKFERYVELELASRVCLSVTQDVALRNEVRGRRDIARREALNQDAMNEPNPKFTPPGGWTLSRGGRTSKNDRGNRSALTG